MKLYLILLTIALALGLALSAMGRILWCSCGIWSPWSWDIWSKHNSQHLIDPYTFSHISHGLIFFILFLRFTPHLSWNMRFILAALIESFWELLENTSWMIERYRSVTMSLDYFGDSVLNSVSDLLFCMLGFAISSRIGTRATLMLLLFTELVLVLTTRDCLTLNILMLLWPIDGIKEWQMQLGSGAL